MKDLHKGTALRSALSKWFPRLDVYVLGWILTFGSLLITTSLWAAARFPLVASSDLWPWRALSQLTILWSITLMAIAMLAVVRANALEPVFGGLDRAVRFHRVLGPSAILLLIAHVVFLALAEFQDGGSLGDLFIPFWSPSTRSIDILAFYALLLLVALPMIAICLCDEMCQHTWLGLRLQRLRRRRILGLSPAKDGRGLHRSVLFISKPIPKRICFVPSILNPQAL